MFANSSARHLRRPSAVLPSIQPALLTYAITPASPIRSLAQRIARENPDDAVLYTRRTVFDDGEARETPRYLRGTLPSGFWSVAVYGPNGTVLYSTTNRDGLGNTLELGIFNQVQTRLLAEQQLNVAEGLLVVEVNQDDALVLVRAAPPHQAVRARYEAALNRLSCGNLRG